MALYSADSFVRDVVLGPRLKIIIMNILPESNCYELKKYPLKIALIYVSLDYHEVPSSKLKCFACN